MIENYQSFNKDETEITINFTPFNRSDYCRARTQRKVFFDFFIIQLDGRKIKFLQKRLVTKLNILDYL